MAPKKHHDARRNQIRNRAYAKHKPAKGHIEKIEDDADGEFQWLGPCKLVPLWMEYVRIPPPFNVKHTLDLRHWMGSPSDPAWMNVIREMRRVVDPSGKTAMPVEKYADAAIARSGYLIHKLKAKDTTGRWAYYFVLVSPEREAQFLRAIEGLGTIDLQDMGTVIASCYGETPTPEVKAYLKARYNLDV